MALDEDENEFLRIEIECTYMRSVVHTCMMYGQGGSVGASISAVSMNADIFFF